MRQDELRRFAAVILDTCLELERGARLRVGGELPHRELMLAIAEGAYERGARAVRLDYVDGRLGRIQADRIAEDYLDEVPEAQRRLSELYAEEAWSYVSIVGEEDPEAFAGADPSRLQRINRAKSQASKKLHEAVVTNKLAWLVVPGPTDAWARSVFAASGRDPGPDPAAALWEALVPILRLDAPDPAAAVRAHMRGLEARAGRLDALKLRELRFRGPGTDLRVALSPRSRWIGGGSTAASGTRFYPNLPTEEVFTSPDWRGTEGRAACTRPFLLNGQRVEGAWLEFKAGEVVASGARENAAALERYLATDRGARRLGEVALVDAEGPIFRSGLVFGNGLIDENAACHIALGSAYEEAFEGAEGIPEEEREGAGYNESLVHEDLMIGSPEVEVLGIDDSGREVPLLSGGRFAV